MQNIANNDLEPQIGDHLPHILPSNTCSDITLHTHMIQSYAWLHLL